MSVPKAAGIETEYGIMVWGANEFSPFQASQLLLNAYQRVARRPAIPMGVYYNVQTGDMAEDPAEFEGSEDGASSAVISYGLGSLMLANGARYYIDHAHPEYCTPESLAPRHVVAADKAGERIVAQCTQQVNSNGLLPDGQQIQIYKNNSDQKGNSYGCHENYLLSMDLFEDLLRRRSHIIYRYLLPYLVTRTVFSGAGKVGYENRSAPASFQLAQRADFFEMLTGVQTTYQRPLFNMRDESHSDRHTFRRLHVILGDANMAEISTYLKIGVTQLVLHMIEDGFIKTDLTLADPVGAFQQVSRDLTFQQPIQLENGGTMTALDVQDVYLEHAERYLEEHARTDEQWAVWERWGAVIDMLRAGNWPALNKTLDWAIKRHVLERYLNGQQTDWATVQNWQPVLELAIKPALVTTAEALATDMGLPWADYEKQREIYFTLRRLDLEYHDIRYEGTGAGLFYRLQNAGHVERLLTEDEIAHYMTTPPPDTRAWLRGKIVERFARQIVGADWSYVKLQQTDTTQKLIYHLEFPNPLLGTEQNMASIWDQLRTPEQLFAQFKVNDQDSDTQN
ncbi:MAG: proteasome accessory factor PafA2 family protein [Anaerolineae bacterium]|nr:proteasome accessory factor PafA2 family protein [Anaerolineae bacterium]